MNPRLAGLLIVVAVLVVGGLIAAALAVIDRRAGVRRKAHYLALSTLEAIEAEVDRYSEVESALAGAVRLHVRRHRRLQHALQVGRHGRVDSDTGS